MVLSTASRNIQIAAFVGQFDQGSGAGKIKIGTAAMAQLLVTHTLNDPACGSPSGGSASLDVDPSLEATIAASGDAAVAQCCDSDDTVFATLTVAKTTGGEINYDENALVAGGTSDITSLTFTQPAGE